MKYTSNKAKRSALVALALAIGLSANVRPSFSTSRPKPLPIAPQDSACAQCRPGDEGRIFSTGKQVQVKILPADPAAMVNLILLLEPVIAVIGFSKEIGKTVCLGPFPPGTELVFGIIATKPSDLYRMGPASSNPDSLTHARVQCLSGRTVVGFEDLPGLTPPPDGSFVPDRNFTDAFIEVSCCDVKCDTINFRPPQFFLGNINNLPRGSVMIGGVNFNAPVSTSNVEAIEITLRGGNLFGGAAAASPLQRLNREFVAAQLSLELAGGQSSPSVVNALWSNLGCPGRFGDFDPIRLSNGVTLGPDSMLKDLFMQAQMALHQNHVADFAFLANIFGELSCDDQFRIPSPGGVKCPPPRGPDLRVLDATCTTVNPGATRVTVKVQNIGDAPAPPSLTTLFNPNFSGPVGQIGSVAETPALMPTGMAELTFNLLGPPPCSGLVIFCPLVVEVNAGTLPIREKTRINNVRIVNCR